ncbi:type VII secretion-associated serine protease mycosin [Mycolicibacterium mucogenicum]|uniref:type VII secretion-associated serine protease mycosin n=1 Tax=Mycolicibacterium mucogenicum TaxID=56689 RepID=UPI00076A4507|nr:type VII secretion-associated serine protease mycosin [Mycolicibacterium mucogenicum]
MRRLAALAAALLLAVASAPPALAIEPPAIDPGAVPPDDTGPDQPMEQRKICSAPTVLPNTNFADKPWAADYLHLAEAQKFATGAGVTVAVIDTGVNASPRVPAEPGGDFVDKGGNGLSDCDAHGTLTASIIAGRPAPTDAFVGVAPEARILSLRQTSEAFQPKDSRSDPNDPNTTQTAGSLRSLARAIVHAANLGAQVINISEAACYKVTRAINETTVGSAIAYAVNVKNAVVVVAAGNTGQDCSQNPPPDAAVPSDPRGWKQVQTIVSPAWYSPLVLTVGGIGPQGQPSNFSMSGPWVGGPIPINGTSFAAAYVSGLAALLRQRFPDLTAAQIVTRITATARHPGGGVDNYVGAGPKQAPYQVKSIPPPVYIPPPDRGPITMVVVAGAALIVLLGLGAVTRRALRRR